MWQADSGCMFLRCPSVGLCPHGYTTVGCAQCGCSTICEAATLQVSPPWGRTGSVSYCLVCMLLFHHSSRFFSFTSFIFSCFFRCFFFFCLIATMLLANSDVTLPVGSPNQHFGCIWLYCAVCLVLIQLCTV